MTASLKSIITVCTNFFQRHRQSVDNVRYRSVSVIIINELPGYQERTIISCSIFVWRKRVIKKKEKQQVFNFCLLATPFAQDRTCVHLNRLVIIKSCSPFDHPAQVDAASFANLRTALMTNLPDPFETPNANHYACSNCHYFQPLAPLSWGVFKMEATNDGTSLIKGNLV